MSLLIKVSEPERQIERERQTVIPGHSDISGRLPAVVRDLAVVAGREAGHHPALGRSSPGGLTPGASPALVISPLQICTAVHGPRPEITGKLSVTRGYLMMSFKMMI